MNESWNEQHDIERGSRLFRRTAAADSGRPGPLAYVVGIFLLGLVAAAGMLGWQIYEYLRYGEWPALSLIRVLQWLSLEWARSPRDWTGLHELLDVIPASVVALVGGVVPAGVWLWREGRSDGRPPLDWGE